MTIKSVLKEQISLVKPSAEDLAELKDKSDEFILLLEAELRVKKIDADVFVGGSFAKGTLVKKEVYDVDIFVRFDWEYDNISDLLQPSLKRVSEIKQYRVERLHGSRDYFRVHINSKSYFELIPVTRIKKPHEEKNVTDLSYFHVSYVRKKMKTLGDELRLAKTFCHGQKVYGAETYVSGFSGYALECLIIHYKSFEKMLRELVKIKLGERIVIDIEKKYKKKDDVFIELNENKTKSPVILIDPTYKERNALASLSHETFARFQDSARAFLKSPSSRFFVEEKLDVERIKKNAKKKKAEFASLNIETYKQEGDIAGTKLKKFENLLVREVKKYFDVYQNEFVYGGHQSAEAYIVAKAKKEVIRIGPPLHLKKHVTEFKKEHMQTYEKGKFIHAKIKVKFKLKAYLDSWIKGNETILSQMGISNIEII